MRNIKLKTSLFLIVGISIICFFILTSIKNLTSITLFAALKLVPKIVSIDAVIITIFSLWLWKWRIFKVWLVPFPNLNGSWRGEIHSTWVDPLTSKVPTAIPALLTIKQSFFKVSCVMRTQEMSSHSCIADFILDKDNQVKRLCFTYDSRPISTVRERSPEHCGTMIFDITDSDKKLEGGYWTGRKTTGHIAMEFWQTKILDSYPIELGEHPVSAAKKDNDKK